MQILLCTDTKDDHLILKAHLKLEKFEVNECLEPVDFVSLAKYADFHVLIIALTTIDDRAVIRDLRSEDVAAPILTITHAQNRDHVVSLLNFGSDDVVMCPYHIDEVIARIHALIRRSNGHALSTIEVRGLTIALHSRKVFFKGTLLNLISVEYTVLTQLALKKGRAVRNYELRSALYGARDEAESNVVQVTISKVRRKLEDVTGDNEFIKTIRSYGYRIDE